MKKRILGILVFFLLVLSFVKADTVTYINELPQCIEDSQGITFCKDVGYYQEYNYQDNNNEYSAGRTDLWVCGNVCSTKYDQDNNAYEECGSGWVTPHYPETQVVDKCLTESQLREYYCTGNNPKSIPYRDVACPNGCVTIYPYGVPVGVCSKTGQTQPVTRCGNGIIEGLENCDDSNMESGDGCENDCTLTQDCTITDYSSNSLTCDNICNSLGLTCKQVYGKFSTITRIVGVGSNICSLSTSILKSCVCYHSNVVPPVIPPETTDCETSVSRTPLTTLISTDPNGNQYKLGDANGNGILEPADINDIRNLINNNLLTTCYALNHEISSLTPIEIPCKYPLDLDTNGKIDNYDLMILSNIISLNDENKIIEFYNTLPNCIDSDCTTQSTEKGSTTGYDINTKQTTTLQDSCEGDKVIEYSCVNGFVEKKYVDCPQGFACRSGICQTTTACTTDLDCQTVPPSPRLKVCIQGICQTTTACTTDSDCLNGLVCIQDACREQSVTTCTIDSDCTNGLMCILGTCQQPSGEPCTTDANCPTGQACTSGICQETTCPTGYDPVCTNDLNCVSSVCEHGNYINQCEADKAGKTVLYKGECTGQQIVGICIHPSTQREIPLGTRINYNSQIQYCSITGQFDNVKELQENCLNDFECRSSVCRDETCVSYEEVRSSIGLIKQIWCKLKSIVSSEDYDTCLAS